MSSSTAGHIIGTDIDNVMYFEDASVNVLSLSLMARSFQIQWNQESRRFTLFGRDGQQFIFQERNGLYLCDFSPLLDARIDQVSQATGTDELLTSVSSNEKLFSRREVVKASLARILLRRLGYTPPQVISKILNQGAMIECPVTSQDLHTATKIYGQLVPELRGKAVKQRGNDTLSTEPMEPISKIDTVMHADIMFEHLSCCPC